MHKLFIKTCLAIVVLVVYAGGVWAEDDFQYWSKYEISKAINSEHEIFYSPEIRFRDDASDFFYHEHRLGLRFKQLENLGIGLHYLFPCFFSFPRNFL